MYLNISIRSLKALRLSSPRFAYLHLIQKNLFGGIRLLATSEHLEHLAQADIRRIAPFVKSITFAAPFSSWTLPFVAYESIATCTQATKKGRSCSCPAHQTRKPIYMQWNNHHYYTEREYDGEFPLSDDDIRATFEQYHHDALATKHLLLDESLREVWTGALRLLQDVHEFRFAVAKANEPGILRLPIVTDWYTWVKPRRHNMTPHSKELCRKAAGLVGDALFATGITCLAKANIEVRHLEVGCETTEQFEWEALPGWPELDLSQMSMFVFNPSTLCGSRVRMIPNILDNLKDPEDHPGAKLAANALSAALQKCKDNLKSLSFGDACPMYWPPDEVIHLPKLTNLALGNGEVRPRNLGSWIGKMPSLDYFKLYASWITLPIRDWLYVLDAIRDHPRGIEIDFFDTIKHKDNKYKAISLQFRTDRIDDWLALSETERLYCSPDWPLYLSGKMKVTDFIIFMESWFDDDDFDYIGY